MKRKKLLKVARRLIGKEYHHLDASVYLKTVRIQVERYETTLITDYLNRLGGRTYTGGISIVCLGETVKRIIEKARDSMSRDQFLDTLGDFLDKKRIKICSLVDDDIEMVADMRDLDNRVHIPELLGFATAIRERANVFMTYDKDMLESTKLREFGKKHHIKIDKPL